MKNKILIAIILFISKSTLAQDPVYSQFYENRLELNPAFCGRDGEGSLRVNAFHRNLYRPIKGPFNNTNLAVDFGMCKTQHLGFGLIASNEIQGDGYLSTNRIDGLVGFRKEFGKYACLSIGIKFGLIFQKVDWNQFTFSDQLDPVLGSVRPSVNTNLYSEFSTAYALTSGVNYTFQDIKDNDHFLGNIGVTWNNFNEPNIGYISKYQLPQRFTFYGALWYFRTKNKLNSSWLIKSRFDIQKNYKTNVLLLEHYFFEELSVGAGYRLSLFNSSGFSNTSSVVLSAGIQPFGENTQVKFLLSYESNIGGLNIIGVGNTFEFGITYKPNKPLCGGRQSKNGKGFSTTPCPVVDGKEVVIPQF
jgi:type IX secretion system PorP/SprF family membrane protein